ncbi:MAG: ammonia-forming cytochrome c nitrite reductase subunit c552 [Candidatus Marinimicrobia bacterium]|nr:ammonia-forming cytochrome c nitrite reductase subunit c552 [Candidatus Neomarinimicrobiota bacterium]
MAQIFPKWTNKLPLILVVGTLIVLTSIVLLIWWFGSPQYTDVGYQPKQPVPYSHKLHAGDLGIDCRYCHTTVETTATASLPPTQTCMNCHQLILPESKKLLPVRESWATGKPLEWVRVHKIPDFAYFDHSVHINAGVGCASCHGNITEMEVVKLVEPLSMSWCLTCHRDPDQHLRPLAEITNMKWTPPDDQIQLAQQFKLERNIKTREDCSTCHR